MNMSNNSTNRIPLLFEEFLLQNANYAYSVITAYFGLPISIAGFVLNLWSLKIFTSSNYTRSTFNTYLRTYCLCGASIELVQVPLLILQNRYVFPQISNTFTSWNILNFFIFRAALMLYVFRSFLDILITLEKIFVFRKQYGALLKLNPILICLIIFFISVLINIPTLFETMIIGVEVALSEKDRNATQLIPLLVPSVFVRTSFGSILINTITVTRSFLPFVILVILDAVLINLFKSYFKKKRNLLGVSATSMLDRAQTKTNMSSTTNDRYTKTKNSIIKSNKININHSERKQIIVTILICLLSIIESLLLCLLFIARQRPLLLSFHLISFLINIYQSIRYFSNYFIFLIFDSVFRKSNRILNFP
jgi:hypothetical protein